MKQFLTIESVEYRPWGYERRQFYGYNLYKQFNYLELSIDISSENRIIKDQLVDALYTSQLIDTQSNKDYIHRLDRLIGDMEDHINASNESLYSKVHELRYQCFGELILNAYYEQMQPLDPQNYVECIDQKDIEAELGNHVEGVMFYLSDLRYIEYLKKDMKKYEGKKRYILLKKDVYDVYINRINRVMQGSTFECLVEEEASAHMNFSKIKWCSEVQELIEQENIFVIGYGEPALLGIKDLRIDSIIKVIPETIFARALTNIFSETGICIIYVPKYFNIYPYVKIMERTKLSYYHLYQLWRNYGKAIYQKNVEQLYINYPECFINTYEDHCGSKLLFEDFKLCEGVFSFEYFMHQKQDYIREYFEGYQGATYLFSYFDTHTLEPMAIQWETKEQKEATLVSGILIDRAKDAGVVAREGETSIRKYLREHIEGNNLHVLSNFLFFSTPKILDLHNTLRKVYPQEQIKEPTGHVDYMMYYENGRRQEAFPLYNKSCIAMCHDGTFRMFKFQLEGGGMTLNGYNISWNKGAVNSEDNTQPVIVYTPYISREDASENFSMQDSITYKKYVGKDRLNIAIVGTEIYCIKKGEILLPCTGVIVSLDTKMEEELLKSAQLHPLDSSYYRIDNLDLQVKLNCPYNVKQEDWNNFSWVYGGAITLIQDGKATFDEQTIYPVMEAEGWATPLSMQTQESDVHRLSRHPRTAIGINKKGQLFILVYSGRTCLSQGVDYIQMQKMASRLIPDIEFMMNVDGGSSSVLGILQEKSFMELSYPAASESTCTGMTRNVKTMLRIELEKR